VGVGTPPKHEERGATLRVAVAAASALHATTTSTVAPTHARKYVLDAVPRRASRRRPARSPSRTLTTAAAGKRYPQTTVTSSAAVARVASVTPPSASGTVRLRDDVAGGDHSDSRREEVDGSDAEEPTGETHRIGCRQRGTRLRRGHLRGGRETRAEERRRAEAVPPTPSRARGVLQNRSSTPLLNRSAARHFAVPSNRVRSASGYRSASSTNTSDPLASAAQNDDGRGRDLDRDRDHSRTRSTSRRSPSRTRSARSSASLRSTVSASSVSSSRSSLRSNSRSSISPRA